MFTACLTVRDTRVGDGVRRGSSGGVAGSGVCLCVTEVVMV